MVSIASIAAIDSSLNNFAVFLRDFASSFEQPLMIRLLDKKTVTSRRQEYFDSFTLHLQDA
ncbi:hypothetical protein B9G53_10410 [Pseudanabaena sp. SR411]|nr:hypothetical protein B9G53_10410 [Pseudanabaena sp. SR411]